MVTGNGNGIVDRLKRLIGIQPTISISSTVTFNPHDSQAPTRFKQAMLKFDKGGMPCTAAPNEQGYNTITGTVVIPLKEFNDLKAQYNN